MIDLGADTDAVRVHVEAMRAGTSTLRERLSTLGTTIRAVDWHGAEPRASVLRRSRCSARRGRCSRASIAEATSSSSMLTSRIGPHRPTGREVRRAAPQVPAVMMRGR